MRLLRLHLSTILFLLAFSSAFAQPATIQSLQIIPASPSPNDTVYAVVTAMVSSMPCGIQNLQINTSGTQVTVDVHYQAGMLPAVCTTTDTVALGTFPPGQYTLTYNATDASYSQVFDSSTGNFTVLGCTDPTSSFVFQTQNRTVTFQNQSQTQGPGTYLWDFDNGQTDTSANPTHQYGADGLYDVCLIVQDSCGSDTSCQQIQVTCVMPSADFVFGGQSVRDVVFTSSVTNVDSVWWDFGDGAGSDQNNLTHTFADTGVFTVCLYAFNECGIDTVCKSVAVHCDFPIVDFTAATSLLTVDFTSLLTNADTFYWDFGDGSSSSAGNPTKVYDSAGVYRVCLVAENGCGIDSACKNVTVECPQTTADFDYSSSSSGIVSFDNLSLDADSFLWDFGTGDSSFLSEPTLNHGANDTLTVCLIAYGLCYNDTLCKEVISTFEDPNSATRLLNEDEIRVYPNPASEVLILEVPEMSVNNEVQLFDPSGKLVFTGEINSPRFEIDVNRYAPGVYLLRVGGSDREYTQKVVISTR